MTAIHAISRWILLFGGAALLAGCVNTDMSDLESYAQKIRARKSGHIEPLPEFKPYQRYLYQAAELGKRDPFKPIFEEAQQQAVTAVDNAQQQKYIDEIKNRNREELEQFELDSLRMVGTLQNKEDLWAIVLDPEGTVHRVRIGNYIGRNYGKIINISEEGIELREIFKNPQGVWEERKASLALNEEE